MEEILKELLLTQKEISKELAILNKNFQIFTKEIIPQKDYLFKMNIHHAFRKNSDSLEKIAKNIEKIAKR